MELNELTDEQQAKLKSCRDSAELKSMLSSMGIELTDEQLESAAGGSSWEQYDSLSCPQKIDP